MYRIIPMNKCAAASLPPPIHGLGNVILTSRWLFDRMKSSKMDLSNPELNRLSKDFIGTQISSILSLEELNFYGGPSPDDKFINALYSTNALLLRDSDNIYVDDLALIKKIASITGEAEDVTKYRICSEGPLYTNKPIYGLKYTAEIFGEFAYVIYEPVYESDFDSAECAEQLLIDLSPVYDARNDKNQILTRHFISKLS